MEVDESSDARVSAQSNIGVARPGSKLTRDHIAEEDMRHCFDLLNKLMAHPNAEAFNQPLNYLDYGWYLYPTIIKSKIPMDLGSIKAMLLRNTLEHPLHFAKHVRVVFENARDFNQEGSDVHTKASTLLHKFNEDFSMFMQELYEKTVDVSAGDPEGEEEKKNDAMEVDNDPEAETKKAEEDQKVKQLVKQVQLLKESVSLSERSIKDAKALRKGPKLRRINLSEPRKPLTYAQKEKLCSDITSLNPNSLPGLLSIIQAAAPPNDEEGEVEIDIEKIDDTTLLKVQDFVQDNLNTGRKRKRGRHDNRANKKRLVEVDYDVEKRRKMKLVAAEEEAKRRLEELRNSSAKSVSFNTGQLVAVVPDDLEDGFWVGKVFSNPTPGTVNLQWYEAKPDTTPVSYVNTGKMDPVSHASIISGLDVQLEFDPSSLVYTVKNSEAILEKIKERVAESQAPVMTH